MCALILLHRVVPDFPVVLAANRDERYDRPADPPALREGRIAYLAPRDQSGGGTWIGTNAAGLVAAVTNRSEAEHDPALPSRGDLIPSTLDYGSAAAARVNLLRQLRGQRRNGYHLLVADAHDAFVIVGGDKPGLVRISPGAHVITNLHEIGELEVHALSEIEQEAPDKPPLDTIGALIDLLRVDTELAPGFTPNKDLGDRGTRSATLVARGEVGQPGMFLHADGPPHQTPFEDHSALLRQIDPRT